MDNINAQGNIMGMGFEVSFKPGDSKPTVVSHLNGPVGTAALTFGADFGGVKLWCAPGYTEMQFEYWLNPQTAPTC